MNTMQVEKPEIIISINIITTGIFIGINHIVSIGFCIGLKTTGEILEIGRYDFNIKRENFNDTFYDKNKTLLDNLQVYAFNESIGIVKFLNLIEEYEEKYTISFLGEHIINDLAWINYYMCIYLPENRRLPIYLNKYGNQRLIIDGNSYIYGIIKFKEEFLKDKNLEIDPKFETNLQLQLAEINSTNNELIMPDEYAKLIFNMFDNINNNLV
jgi:hypothetical protein